MIRAMRQRIPLSDSTLLRLVLLLSLAIGLLGIGLVTPRVSPELVLIAVAAPPVLLLALGQLEYGVLAIVLTAAFVRFSLSTGTASRVVASLLVTCVFLVLWMARAFVVDKRLRLKPSSTNVPLLAFVLTVFISYVWGNAFRDPLVVVKGSWTIVQLGGLAVMVLLPGAFLLTANTISELRWLKLLCGLFIFVGVLALVDKFLPIRFSFLNTGGLFSLWFVSLTYAQALFNRKMPFLVRLALLGLVGVWMYVYFAKQVTWLAGWLPSFVALVTISLIKSRRLFLLLLLLVAVYVGLKWNYYTGTVIAAESDESGDTRLAAWKQNWVVTKEHLLFGTGPAGYAAYYMSYFPTHAMATHSNYIDIVSQTGIVGLFSCVWFFGALAWEGFRLCMRLNGAGDFSAGLANGALAGCVGCILAMAIGDWLFPFVYTQTIAGFDYAVYSWVLLGTIVALNHMAPAGQTAEVRHG